jgi:hypothetical protein
MSHPDRIRYNGAVYVRAALLDYGVDKLVKETPPFIKTNVVRSIEELDRRLEADGMETTAAELAERWADILKGFNKNVVPSLRQRAAAIKHILLLLEEASTAPFEVMAAPQNMRKFADMIGAAMEDHLIPADLFPRDFIGFESDVA